MATLPLLSGAASAAPGGVPGPNPDAPGQQPEPETGTARVARGNAGTVKVDGVAFDEHPDNEPHVDCVFQIDFYGFHADSATVTFDLQAPTASPNGDPLLEDEISFAYDGDVSGNTLVGSRTYDLSDQLAASGAEPRDQGFHIKLSVDSAGTPGGAKQKVFWVVCATDEEQVGSLAVSKTVTGDAPTDAVFGFEVVCDGDVRVVFQLGAGETRLLAQLPAGSRCTVAETDNGEADSVTVSVAGSSRAGTVTTVVIAADEVAAVAFTNGFEEVLVGGNPGDGTPAGETSPDGTSSEGTQSGGTPAGETSPGGTSSEGTQAGTPAGDTSADGTSSDATEAGGIVAVGSTAGETSSDETSSVDGTTASGERLGGPADVDRGAERMVAAAAGEVRRQRNLATTGADALSQLILALLALLLGGGLLRATRPEPGPAYQVSGPVPPSRQATWRPQPGPARVQRLGQRE
ncbi:MAG: DUF5979 domain-containing protein [Actinomycetota bacterium]|nr:DUF5979 domain-containing protein [Actinomycetota bacterium]